MYVSLRHPFGFALEMDPRGGWLLDLSGAPSLLAFAALVGFVLVQAVLKFAF